MVFFLEGRYLKDIIFFVRNMVCIIWGGKDLDILYIVMGKDRKLIVKVDDEGGYMFKYYVEGIKGMLKFEFGG